MATRLIQKLAKSEKRWAASVMMAKLLDKYPPTISPEKLKSMYREGSYKT